MDAARTSRNRVISWHIHDPLGARVCKEVFRSFQTSGYRGMHRLRCEMIEGKMELRGTVPTYYLKQLAQEIALLHKDVSSVENHIQVR